MRTVLRRSGSISLLVLALAPGLARGAPRARPAAATAPAKPPPDETPAPAADTSTSSTVAAVSDTTSATPTTTSTSTATSASVTSRPVSEIFKSWAIHVGLITAAPLYFKDTPDTKLEATTVFQYGGRISFLLGDELLDLHRFGLGLGYAFVAHSDSRTASMFTPTLLYEIGHPLILQVGIGYSVGIGTDKFASNYSGVYTQATLKYSFRSLMQRSPVGVSIGLHSSFVFSTTDIGYSSAYLGAQVELTYHQTRD
jgi:hypothetical protein